LVASNNPDDSISFYHSDHLGSVSAVTDEAGELIESTRYYPYGAIRQGGTASRYLYTGQESDPETGFYYYGARFYDPELRRFVQPDLILPDAYDPQQLNRYSYVINNPLVYIDPTGNYTLKEQLEATWTMFFADYDSLSDSDQLARNQFWYEVSEYSEEHDEQIRRNAALIGSIPVFGDLYADNYLALFGKIEHDEFVTRLTINSIASFISACTGGVHDGGIGLVAGSTKENLAWQLGYIDFEEYLTNMGGVALDYIGGRIVDSARPMRYARANPFSRAWFLGLSENYRRINWLIQVPSAVLYEKTTNE
jgi:RHS repeat-associated protein